MTKVPGEPTKAHVERYRKRLAVALSNALKGLKLIQHPGDEQQHLAVMCLYGVVVQSTVECQRLLNASSIASVGAVLRSILESYADLCAVIKDPTYVKRMFATFSQEKIRVVEQMQQFPNNPFLAGASTGIDLKVILAETKSELLQSKTKGQGPLTQKDRFKAGALNDLYASVYWYLCLYSHNNIAMIDSRYLHTRPDDVSVIVFKATPNTTFVTHFDSLLSVLIDTSERVHTLFESGMASHWTQAAKELQEFREKTNSEINSA